MFIKRKRKILFKIKILEMTSKAADVYYDYQFGHNYKYMYLCIHFNKVKRIYFFFAFLYIYKLNKGLSDLTIYSLFI